MDVREKAKASVQASHDASRCHTAGAIIQGGLAVPDSDSARIMLAMETHAPRIALFPGTFDPITNGHLDIIQRGRKLFDQLVVAVGHNPEKRHLFTQQERGDMIRELVADMPDVRVDVFTGLTVDYARRIGAAAILRGIRNFSDLQFEFQVALTNRTVAGVETVFIMTSEQFTMTSSSLIKQVAGMGGDVSALVPPNVVRRMRDKQRSMMAAPDAQLEETP